MYLNQYKHNFKKIKRNNAVQILVLVKDEIMLYYYLA